MTKKQTVTPAQIEKIADLSKLHLDTGQLDTYTGQINEILDHVDQLGELDIDDVEPISHVLELVYPGRPDVVAKSTARPQVLGNSPEITKTGQKVGKSSDDEFFHVPVVKKNE